MGTENHNLPSRAAIEAEIRYRAEHEIESFYPDTGPLRLRHLHFLRVATAVGWHRRTKK